MKSDLQSQSQVYDSFETDVVQVYLRNVKKEARLVPLHTPAKSTDLTIIASTRFNIPEERVILFYNGFRVDNYEMPINLVQRSIIHILDRRNLSGPKINVHFKPIGWNPPSLRLCLSTDSTIKQIMSLHLAPKYNIEETKFFIVYAGKTLNPSNSLKEEYVEDDSELIVIQHKPAKEAFQRQVIEYNASYHIEQNGQSSVKNNCPVTYLTSFDALKKKNQQQAALIQQQNSSQVAPAAPKPFPLPSFPVLNDSFINANPPFNINISTIRAQNGEHTEEPIAPSQIKSKKMSKQSSEVERCAPLPEEKSGQPKIKINKTPSEIATEDKHKHKIILQLESTNQANPKEHAAFPFPHFMPNDSQHEKDHFEGKSVKPSHE